MDNVLDKLDEQAAKENAGGGIIAQVRFEAGYKLFVGGLGNRESFFPYTPGNDADAVAALAKAKGVAEKHAYTKSPQTSAQIVIYKNSVKGREVTWKDDRYFTYPVWTDAYKKALKPSLAKAGIAAFGEYWVRVEFVPDPSGRKKKDQNGVEVVDQVAIIAERYADEAAATKAAQKAKAEAGGNVSVPDGYTSATWAKQKDDIAALRLSYIKAGQDAHAATEKAAGDYGATAEQVYALLGITAPDPEQIPF